MDSPGGVHTNNLLQVTRGRGRLGYGWVVKVASPGGCSRVAPSETRHPPELHLTIASNPTTLKCAPNGLSKTILKT